MKKYSLLIFFCFIIPMIIGFIIAACTDPSNSIMIDKKNISELIRNPDLLIYSENQVRDIKRSIIRERGYAEQEKVRFISWSIEGCKSMVVRKYKFNKLEVSDEKITKDLKDCYQKIVKTIDGEMDQ